MFKIVILRCALRLHTLYVLCSFYSGPTIVLSIPNNIGPSHLSICQCYGVTRAFYLLAVTCIYSLVNKESPGWIEVICLSCNLLAPHRQKCRHLGRHNTFISSQSYSECGRVSVCPLKRDTEFFVQLSLFQSVSVCQLNGDTGNIPNMAMCVFTFI